MDQRALVELILSAPRSLDRRVGACMLAGFPAMGKSTIAEALVRRSSKGQVLAVSTESYILPWKERERLHLSGCSPRAYDLPRCAKDVGELLRGMVVEVPVYRRPVRGCTSETRRAVLPSGGLLVLDGSCSSSPVLALSSYTVLFFVPENGQAWLDFATARDCARRGYRYEQSEDANRTKAMDCALLYAASRDLISATAVVAAASDGTATRLEYSLLNGAPWEDVGRCLPPESACRL
jgi:uridine kinase